MRNTLIIVLFVIAGGCLILGYGKSFKNDSEIICNQFRIQKTLDDREEKFNKIQKTLDDRSIRFDKIEKELSKIEEKIK